MRVSNINSLPSHEQFAVWLASPLGQYVLERERRFFDRAVADVFGYYAVQLELPGLPLLQANRMPTRLVAGLSDGCQLSCDPRQLPFPAASVDLLLLPHTLDFHPDPRAVLREVERVLVPEGRLVLTGFNPRSLWGAARLGKRRRGVPWQGQFLSLPRLKDWLALLDFEAEGGRICCYAPPLSSPRWQERFAFMEAAGDRWWPVGGGVYCLEMVKRVRGMRLIAPSWKRAGARVRQVAVAVPDRHSPHEE
ncbi:methyltransferase domain-containing protein [Chitinimonas arctica]|uniref:Methyltransferase domain-containing protein n=1 Tax=Chitinimonas arctica TaxID=2594795 RepID=A0A516SHL8_9NEIS|nr:methyltransferase domain-containing protein [Chitinimonas arctica]QDQ27538.1 methyltransferase domain-containing protein [Chitinimonas arctica]